MSHFLSMFMFVPVFVFVFLFVSRYFNELLGVYDCVDEKVQVSDHCSCDNDQSPKPQHQKGFDI